MEVEGYFQRANEKKLWSRIGHPVEILFRKEGEIKIVLDQRKPGDLSLRANSAA